MLFLSTSVCTLYSTIVVRKICPTMSIFVSVMSYHTKYVSIYFQHSIKWTLNFLNPNQHYYTKSYSDFRTLKLALTYFSFINKPSRWFEPCVRRRQTDGWYEQQSPDSSTWKIWLVMMMTSIHTSRNSH